MIIWLGDYHPLLVMGYHLKVGLRLRMVNQYGVGLFGQIYLGYCLRINYLILQMVGCVVFQYSKGMSIQRYLGFVALYSPLG